MTVLTFEEHAARYRLDRARRDFLSAYGRVGEIERELERLAAELPAAEAARDEALAAFEGAQEVIVQFGVHS